MSSVFISYSHRDAETMERLRVHLKPLERHGTVRVFSDQDIRSDEEWRERIRTEIEEATVGVLLVSADFLASDFVNEEELPRLFRLRREKNKQLLTVFVAHCNYEEFPDIAKYQAFNSPSVPVSDLVHSEREKLYAGLVSEIKKAVASEDHEHSGSGQKHPNLEYYNGLRVADPEAIQGRRLFSEMAIHVPAVVAISGPDLTGFAFEW